MVFWSLACVVDCKPHYRTIADCTCEAGYFCDGEAFNATEYYSNSFGSRESDCEYECTECPSGRVSSEQWVSACDACEEGKYAETVALTECEDCERGRYVNTTGASDCLDCDKGSSTNVTGSIACDLCERGYHTNATGSALCSLCADGYVALELGTEVCDACGTGEYWFNTTLCVLCDPGQYNDEEAQLACL